MTPVIISVSSANPKPFGPAIGDKKPSSIILPGLVVASPYLSTHQPFRLLIPFDFPTKLFPIGTVVTAISNEPVLFLVGAAIAIGLFPIIFSAPPIAGINGSELLIVIPIMFSFAAKEA